MSNLPSLCLVPEADKTTLQNYATQNRADTGSYRIPISIQFAWGIILATGLYLLPESPRYFVKRGAIDAAAGVLARLRGQPLDSVYIQVRSLHYSAS